VTPKIRATATIRPYERRRPYEQRRPYDSSTYHLITMLLITVLLINHAPHPTSTIAIKLCHSYQISAAASFPIIHITVQILLLHTTFTCSPQAGSSIPRHIRDENSENNINKTNRQGQWILSSCM
jgi:hypothetical protein